MEIREFYEKVEEMDDQELRQSAEEIETSKDFHNGDRELYGKLAILEKEMADREIAEERTQEDKYPDEDKPEIRELDEECPDCGHEPIYVESDNKTYKNYFCNNCGWSERE